MSPTAAVSRERIDLGTLCHGRHKEPNSSGDKPTPTPCRLSTPSVS